METENFPEQSKSVSVSIGLQLVNSAGTLGRKSDLI